MFLRMRETLRNPTDLVKVSRDMVRWAGMPLLMRSIGRIMGERSRGWGGMGGVFMGRRIMSTGEYGDGDGGGGGPIVGLVELCANWVSIRGYGLGVGV